MFMVCNLYCAYNCQLSIVCVESTCSKVEWASNTNILLYFFCACLSWRGNFCCVQWVSHWLKSKINDIIYFRVIEPNLQRKYADPCFLKSIWASSASSTLQAFFCSKVRHYTASHVVAWLFQYLYTTHFTVISIHSTRKIHKSLSTGAIEGVTATAIGSTDRLGYVNF